MYKLHIKKQKINDFSPNENALSSLEKAIQVANIINKLLNIY